MDIDSDLREQIENLESEELPNGRMKHETIKFETEEELDPDEVWEHLHETEFDPQEKPLDGVLRTTLHNWDDATRLWIRVHGTTIRLAHNNKFADDPRATTEQFIGVIETLQTKYTLSRPENDD